MPVDFEEVGSARHAGVVGADDDLSLVLELFLGFVEIFVKEFFKVVFSVDLVLGGGNNDVVIDNSTSVVGFSQVIEDTSRGFDDTDANTSNGIFFDGGFGLNLDGF